MGKRRVGLVRILVGIVLCSILAEGVAWAQREHGHVAPHGGVLNVIGKELGHIEVLVREDRIEAWLLGGGEDTVRSVPIRAAEISLVVKIPGKGQRKLILKSDPLKLAGEGPGHCSHFVGRADWLREVKEFNARGKVVFKGLPQELVIEYPRGYDPYHRAGQGHH